MAEEGREELVKRQVEGIIRELFGEIERSVGADLPNRKLPDEVADWWMMHYRAKFYYAIDYKKLSYESARDELMKKARELGTALRGHAQGNSMTRQHAAYASFDVDCREQGAKIMWDWCN